MKHIFAVLLLSAVLAGSLFAQYGDARSAAMAGAMTGLADDGNAMFHNPAGIGFLKKSYFTVDTNIGFGLTKRMVFGTQEYPDFWEDYDNQGNTRYVYWDDFLGTNVAFDPADFGFAWDPDEQDIDDDEALTYEQAVELYRDFRTYYDAYEGFTNVYDVGAIPRVVWQGDIIGAAAFARLSTDLRVSDYRGEETVFSIDVHRDQGVLAAGGFKLGIFGIGANFKAMNRVTGTIAYDADDFQYGPPETLVPDLLLSGSEAVSDSRFELGLGAMATLGPFNAGAYIDNLLFFIESDESGTTADTKGILDTMSVGASWTPFDRKRAEKRGILNLILSGDLKNFGSPTNRELAVGVETGLNFGNVIVMSGRAGYRQPLPGELSEMSDSFDPAIAVYSVGAGAKFLFAQVDVAALFPADMALDPPMTGTISEERLGTPFASFVVNVSMSF